MPWIRDTAALRRLGPAAALVVAGLAVGGIAAPARGADVFEVAGVAVDVTAETAAAARKRALADGEREAFRRMLRRLTLRADWGRLPRLDAEAVADLVRHLSVADEKTSPVRYLAKLTFRFKGEGIRGLLADYGIPFAVTPSKPVLVLPVYRAAGALMLWDEPNPWREAWGAARPAEGLMPVVLPLGDLADIAAIGAEQAVDGDPQRLAAVARRYGADDALVVYGNRRVEAGGRSELEVFVTRHSQASHDQTFVKSFAPKAGEPFDSLLARAAVEIGHLMQDDWKRDNLLRLGVPTVIAAKVPVQALGDWLTVRRRLGEVAIVRRLEVVLLSLDEVRVNVHYVGAPDQLSVALRQADLTLVQDGEEWVLGLAEADADGGG